MACDVEKTTSGFILRKPVGQTKFEADAHEVGQRCRLERIFDCFRKRQVDIAQELRSRNRSRHASRRAEELDRELDDEVEWAKNYRSFHLGEKLIALAVRFAEFAGER